jgi:hypothetical protein
MNNPSFDGILSTITPLSYDRWNRAKDNTINIIKTMNPEPNPKDYINRSKISKYPGWFTFGFTVMLMIVAIGAFWVSAGKQIAATDLTLNPIAKDFSSKLSSTWADIGIIMTLLLGEIGTILFSAASAIYPSKDVYFIVRGNKVHPIMLFFRLGSFLSAGFALVGNVTITMVHKDNNAGIDVFKWFLTIGAPVIVLFIGLLLERQLLAYFEDRAIAQELFNKNHAVWELAHTDTENHPSYKKFLFTQILAQLKQLSKANREKIEIAENNDPMIRIALIQREIARNDWANQELVSLITANPTLPQIPGQTD